MKKNSVDCMYFYYTALMATMVLRIQSRKPKEKKGRERVRDRGYGALTT